MRRNALAPPFPTSTSYGCHRRHRFICHRLPFRLDSCHPEAGDLYIEILDTYATPHRRAIAPRIRCLNDRLLRRLTVLIYYLYISTRGLLNRIHLLERNRKYVTGARLTDTVYLATWLHVQLQGQLWMGDMRKWVSWT